MIDAALLFALLLCLPLFCCVERANGGRRIVNEKERDNNECKRKKIHRGGGILEKHSDVLFK